MCLNRVWLCVTLATLVLFAAVRTIKPRLDEFDVADPDTRLHASMRKGGVLLGSLRLVQSKNARNPAAGKLLVASRGLADPRFAQTVVLLVRYDAQGIVGLTLNRRTNVPLSRVLGGLKAAKDRSDPVYLGGPVEMPAMFALFQSPAKIDGAELIFDSVYLISAKPVFEQAIAARPDPGAFHVYLGYAGWNKDQLRNEVELGAWFVFPADASTVFNTDPDSLWLQMIRRTELKVAWSGPVNQGVAATRKDGLVISPTQEYSAVQSALVGESEDRQSEKLEND